MPDERENAILKNLKQKIKELNYGTLLVEFTIHNGTITKGIVKLKEESLG